MFRLTSCLAVLIGVTTSSTALGVQLYSVNGVTDQLVTINSDTGVITPVGGIGHDIKEPAAMTTMDGIIYCIAQVTPGFNLDGMTLVALEHDSGAAVSSTNLFYNNNGNDTQALFGESITAANGQLIFGWGGSGTVSSSTALINPVTGEVTDWQQHGVDLDNLATDLGGQIVANNGINYSGNTRQMAFYDIDRDPPTTAFRGDFLLVGSIADMTITPSGLFALNRLDQSLLKIDISGSPTVVGTVPLGAEASQLGGLTYVPEPSTLVLLFMGAVGLVAYALRKRRRC